MKIVVLDTYYPAFLRSFYQTLSSNSLSYCLQHQALIAACFGTSDFYSFHLNRLGWEAHDLIANCVELQCQWSLENNFKFSQLSAKIPPKAYRIPFIGRLLSGLPGLTEVAIHQIKLLNPDVLYCQDLSFFRPEILSALRPYVKLIVGQIACPPPPDSFLRGFDLILTSFPHFVENFRLLGINSEYFKIGFDDRILKLLGNVDKDINFSFVGGMTKNHSIGNSLLHFLAENSDITFFGYGYNTLSIDSPILMKHCGEVWGLQMYRTLARSHLTLNRHINAAGNYANNMRLYEATGVGSMLITDAKTNLQDLFEIGKEVVAYTCNEEALELATYFQQNPSKAKQIAVAGQMRTLRDHTYSKRMEELSCILKMYLSSQ
jgi:spore maturation protein CgeB